MASPSTNPVLQLLITAKDQASGILTNLKTQLAALGVAIGGAFSIKEAATFEKALDAVRARADETGPALDALIGRVKEAAQTLGPEFGFSATQAVGGIKELIAAGFTADESMQALKGTLALAAMEGINVSQAAVLISDSIAQFGLTAADATKVADILAASAGAVAATAVDMAEALKYTGTAASLAGLSLTETSAVLDVLAKSGQRGSEAGTGLASVLNILSNPSHAATKALFDLGATGTELGETLDLLKGQGLNAAETIALFGEQGGRVINTLLAQGGTAAIADFADQITNSGKSAADTAKIMQDNLLGAFDRFWESLKRVGTELATPKLEPFANGLDILTESLNTFASNAKIQAFQQAMADGFSAIYTAARDFANQIDWEGVSTVIGNAFSTIKSAADSALTSLQSIVASLTGTLPGAASLAQTASDGLKFAWDGLGSAAAAVSGGLDKIAQSLSGPVTSGSDLAQRAMAGLTGATDAARSAYDTLNSALKTGTVSQDEVTAAWERLQTVMAGAQTEIDAAQIAYNAVVAAQQAGAATQEQVNAAWERLQTVMGSAQSRIDSAKLAYEGLNLQFTTGAGIADAVAVAHDRLDSTLESARQSIEKITSAVDGQTQGFQTLWAALQSEAPTFLKTTFDSLATAAGSLLAGINALAQEGAKFIAGFIKNADLSPVRDLFNAVADAARKLTNTIIDAFPQAEKAGANFADSFTVAWSGVVGILAAVVAGTLKVVESIGRATFEVGKYFDRYSKEEIAKIEANLNGLSVSAGEFAAVAARAFDSSGEAIDRMRVRSEQATTQQDLLKAASEGNAEAQQKLADAALRQAQAQGDAEAKARALALALKLQQAEMERLAAADLSGEEAKNKHAAATQKLWDLQEQFGEAVKGLTEEQFANAKASEGMAEAFTGLNEKLEAGGATLTEYVGKNKTVIPTLEELRQNLETTRATMDRVNQAHQDGTLKATEHKSITEQLNEAQKDAGGALGAYNAAIERNVAAEELAIKTAQSKRQANEAVAQSGEALIDASIRIAEINGIEWRVAELVVQKKKQQAESAQKVAAEYWKEADAAVRIAEALQLKAAAMERNSPLDTVGIANAKEAAAAANAEAVAKQAAAIAAGAKADVAAKESQAAQLGTDASKKSTEAAGENTKATKENAEATDGAAKSAGGLAEAVGGLISYWRQQTAALSEATAALFELKAGLAGAVDVGILGGLSDEAKKATQEIEKATYSIKQFEQQMLFSTGSVGYFMDKVQKAGHEATRSYYEQKLAAEALEEQINNVGVTAVTRFGTTTAAVNGMTDSVENSITGFNLLNDQDLDQLRSAMADANNRLREMQEETQSAKDRLSELNAEILEAQGQDQKAALLRQQLDYQQQLAEIEKQRTEAELLGNRDLVAILNEQASKLKQLNDLRVTNIKAETDTGNDSVKTANAVRTAWREVGDEVDIVSQKAKGIDFSGVVAQSSQLKTNFNDLSALL